ncbi:hypothetical protein L873DRAFT_1801512, partial [Choiromyces venosus 120613-1]
HRHCSHISLYGPSQYKEINSFLQCHYRAIHNTRTVPESDHIVPIQPSNDGWLAQQGKP